MWINVSEEEYAVITQALEHCNLYGLSFLMRTKRGDYSQVNINHTRENAVKAAQTYFSANDLIIENDCVRWTDDGDALVMAWQKVPAIFIEEQKAGGCGCKSDEVV